MSCREGGYPPVDSCLRRHDRFGSLTDYDDCRTLAVWQKLVFTKTCFCLNLYAVTGVPGSRLICQKNSSPFSSEVSLSGHGNDVAAVSSLSEYHGYLTTYPHQSFLYLVGAYLSKEKRPLSTPNFVIREFPVRP